MNGNADEQRLLHQRRKLRDEIIQPSASEMESGDTMFKIFDKTMTGCDLSFRVLPAESHPGLTHNNGRIRGRDLARTKPTQTRFANLAND